MDARMEAYGQQFPVDFVGGPYDGQYGATKWKVNEIETHGERHPDCLGWVKHLYRRSNPDSQKFYYVETLNDTQGCQQCEKSRERIAKYEAEKAEREAFAKFQKTINVVIRVGDSGGYDWSEAEIGKSPDGRIWIRYGSGCSCNSIEDEDWQALTNRNQAVGASRHLDSPIARANFIAKAQELLGATE